MFCLKNRRRFLVGCSVCGIFISLLSCKETKKETGLYPIDSILTSQVRFLTASKATLQKEATIGTEKDDSTYVPTDTVWNRELGIFRQLHTINKPVNQENYIVADGIRDAGSNLIIKAFTARTPMPVRYLKVFYQKSLERPRKIEHYTAKKIFY
jgi:hypothetical protein